MECRHPNEEIEPNFASIRFRAMFAEYNSKTLGRVWRSLLKASIKCLEYGDDFEVEHMETAQQQENGATATAIGIGTEIFSAAVDSYVSMEEDSEGECLNARN